MEEVAVLDRNIPHTVPTITEQPEPDPPPRILLPLATWQAIARPPLRYDWPGGVELPY